MTTVQTPPPIHLPRNPTLVHMANHTLAYRLAISCVPNDQCRAVDHLRHPLSWSQIAIPIHRPQPILALGTTLIERKPRRNPASLRASESRLHTTKLMADPRSLAKSTKPRGPWLMLTRLYDHIMHSKRMGKNISEGPPPPKKKGNNVAIVPGDGDGYGYGHEGRAHSCHALTP